MTSKTFYFPLPVAEYPALELSIGNGATSKVLKTKALDAKRNERYTTTITLDEVSGSVPTTVESVSAVADALKETNSVSVADVASTEPSPTVSIPKKDTPAENVSISFENISTTNAVAIKEESTGTGGTAAPKNVLVSVPQLDTSFPVTYIIHCTISVNGQFTILVYGKCIARFVGDFMTVQIDDNFIRCGNSKISRQVCGKSISSTIFCDILQVGYGSINYFKCIITGQIG